MEPLEPGGLDAIFQKIQETTQQHSQQPQLQSQSQSRSQQILLHEHEQRNSYDDCDNKELMAGYPLAHHSHQSLNGSFDINNDDDGGDFNADTVVPDPISSNNSKNGSEENCIFVPDTVIINNGNQHRVDHHQYREENGQLFSTINKNHDDGIDIDDYSLCLGAENNDDHDGGSSLDTIFADFTAITDITRTKKNCSRDGNRKRKRSKPPSLKSKSKSLPPKKKTKSTVAMIESQRKTQKNKTNTGISSQSKVKSKPLSKSKATSKLKSTTKVNNKRVTKTPKKKVKKPPSVRTKIKKTATAKSKANIISEPVVAASVSTTFQIDDCKMIERSTSFSTLEEATLTEMPYSLTLEEDDDEWNDNKQESKSKSNKVDFNVLRVVESQPTMMFEADPPATLLFEADPPVSPRYDILKEESFESKACTKTQQHEKWMDFVRRLVLYKKEHNGSTDVPRYYEKDKDLGCWVKNQRDKRKHGSYELTEKRINELNSIGFVWDSKQLDQQQEQQELCKQTTTQQKPLLGA